MQNQVVVEESLTLDKRNKLSMTGVIAVDGFTEQSLKLSVGSGKVFITGENIKITSYNKANGNLSADGKFNQIKYGQEKAPIMKRIFK